MSERGNSSGGGEVLSSCVHERRTKASRRTAVAASEARRSVASKLVVATRSFTNCSARSNLLSVAREQFDASTLSSTTPPDLWRAPQ